MLKKIPGVLANFKKKLSAGKKEEVQNNIEDLQDEIKSSGVLSKFRNAKGLQKTIFTTMAVLMLAAVCILLRELCLKIYAKRLLIM